jgi:integrase/recombinase XerD
MVTLQEALTEFCEEQQYKGNSPRTVEFYSETVEHFIKDTGACLLGDFNERRIRSWLLSHRGLSSVTLATYDRALRVLANWLYNRGYVSEHPMKLLPRPKAKRAQVVVFTPAEVMAMLVDAKGRRNPLRDVALIMLLLDTGLRIGEATTLRLQDIQWTEGFLSVNGKTGERVVPFGRKVKAALKRYIDRERIASNSSVREVFLTREGVPFRSKLATYHLRKIARRANVKASKQGPHTFRHTFALEFIRAGGDAFTLQRLLGHTTLDMTRRYVHLAQTDLRAAHRRFAPGDCIL